MSLQERIRADWKEAMKARDNKKEILSFILNELKNEAIERRSSQERGTALMDEGAIAVLRRLAKQRKEAMESYNQAGRADLVQKEMFELGVVESYLPQALEDEALHHLIDQAIGELQASTLQDMGKVIARVLGMAQGRADGQRVQNAVRERLSKKPS